MTTKSPRRSYGNNDKMSSSSCSNASLPETLPIIGLGCSSFSTFFFSEEELAKLEPKVDDWSKPPKDHPLVQHWVDTIKHAILDCRIDLLDTAPWYGHGSSEIVIGYAMEELLGKDSATSNVIDRKEFVINTKLGRYEGSPDKMFDYSAMRVAESVQTSLQRMKCNYIDVLQLHDPEYSPSIDLLVNETIPAMAKLRGKGKVKAIGMTGYPLETQWELMERSRKEHNILFDQCLTYSHYNLHDQSVFTPLFPSEEGKISFDQYCRKYNIGLTAAAPLSMGLLAPQDPPAWHPASTDLKEACSDAAAYCQANGANIAEVALLYAFEQERIPCTILGMKNVSEVDRAMKIVARFAKDDGSAGTKQSVLTEEERRIITHLLDKVNGPFAQVCKNGNFQWDGLKDGVEFWEKMPGGQEEAANRMHS
jgi:L-galactose dehydrogenase